MTYNPLCAYVRPLYSRDKYCGMRSHWLTSGRGRSGALSFVSLMAYLPKFRVQRGTHSSLRRAGPFAGAAYGFLLLAAVNGTYSESLSPKEKRNPSQNSEKKQEKERSDTSPNCTEMDSKTDSKAVGFSRKV